MIILRNTLRVAVAALLVSGVGLTACEKSSDAASTPTASDDSDAGAGGSTVPDLPALGGPMFSPDLVYRVGVLDLFAVAEAKVALSRSQNPDVKAFASSAIDAHSKSLSAIGAVIDASNQTISVPDTLSNELSLKVAALQSADPGSFDKTYIADQIFALSAADSAMKTYAKHGDTAQFKSFASSNIPGVESSLASARTLQSSLK